MSRSIIYVIRHGQTDENINRIIQGQKDTLLNDVGIEQAKKLAETLKDIQFDIIYTSDLKRAHDTANMVAEYHENVPVNLTELLRERHMGDLQGQVYRQTRSAAVEATIESTKTFKKRISTFWDQVLLPQLRRNWEDNGDRTVNIAIVSHGAWIGALTQILVQERGYSDDSEVPHDSNPTFRFCPNASLTTYELQGNTGRLLKYGDTSHLNSSIISLGNSDQLVKS